MKKAVPCEEDGREGKTPDQRAATAAVRAAMVA
jgi:hypothetical protein